MANDMTLRDEMLIEVKRGNVAQFNGIWMWANREVSMSRPQRAVLTQLFNDGAIIVATKEHGSMWCYVSVCQCGR